MSNTRTLPALLAALGGLVFLPGAASAAVGGSAHDIVAQEYDVAKEDGGNKVCGPCHMRLSRKDWNLLQKVPPSLSPWSRADLACFSCHDGTTIVSPDVDASRTAFHPLSHGYDVPEGLLENVSESGLPVKSDGRMGCRTCHDPHDNSDRPFLRAARDGLCLTCHTGLTGEGGEDKSFPGNHPLESVDEEEGVVERAPIVVADDFRVGFPDPYPLQKGKEADGAHWKLGGHLEEGESGRMLCITCHAVHGGEGQAPRERLLSRDPVRVAADLFCEGCHRGERGDGSASEYAPNPGATVTARTYHPADDDTGNGVGRLVPITEPAGWPFGEGKPAELLCTTCHRPHGADPDTALLRAPGEGGSFCETCHEGVPAPHHHPAGENLQGPCVANVPAVEGAPPGSLPCRSCHQAHNAGLGDREDEHVPLLKQAMTSMDFCLTCHPEDDPVCGTDQTGKASHFLGDSTLPDTYGLAEASLRRTAWPGSGLESYYGGDAGNSVVCLSCHTFKEGAFLDEAGGGYLLARSGRDVEWEDTADPGSSTGYNSYLCTGCHLSRGTTGPNHPLMSANKENLKTPPTPPVTTTPGGKLNCDSCHSPHGAKTASGYYILEDVTGENTDPMTVHPKIDFTTLCYHCHDSSNY